MDERDLLTLQFTEGLSASARRFLAEKLDGSGDLERAGWPTLLRPFCRLDDRSLELRLDRAQADADFVMTQARRQGITLLPCNSPAYPPRLRQIADYPLMLYARGSLEALRAERAVAVIGSREPTSLGFQQGKAYARLLAELGYTVVSGLARGCDTAGHIGCLEGGGRTVAVLPGELEQIYPRSNRGLAARILENGGCLASEYAPGERSRLPGERKQAPPGRFFVERDRIQSGLSLGLLVVETYTTGGTLHTVNFARRQGGRVIACIDPRATGGPDYPDEESVQGNLKLISEGVALPVGRADSLERFLDYLETGPPDELFPRA